MIRLMTNRHTATAAHVTDLSPDGAPVPEWVHLLPAGSFTGRDGRGPYLLDDEGVINAFDGWGADLSIDYDHQGVHAADNGQPAPAAGWIKQIRLDDAGIWGRVEWTERAAQMIAAKEYRYLSPVFTYDKASGRVLKLLNAGLTNNPNLHLTALNTMNAVDLPQPVKETPGMDELVERLRYLLNLPTASTADEIAAELQKLIGQLKAAPVEAMRIELGTAEGDLAGLLNAAHARISDIATYVPRADFEAVSHELATLKEEKITAAIELAVNSALDAGKILPAQVEHATSMARADLATFAAFIESAPVIAPAGETATHARAVSAVPSAPTSGLKVPAGYGVDGEGYALHQRAIAHQEQHPDTGYLAAVHAVTA